MRISNEIRKRIIEAYFDKKISKADIALTFNLKLTSVYAILTVFKKEGRVQKKLKGGPRRKLIGEDHKVFIKEAINNDCGITIRSWKEMLLSKFNINVFLSTISKYIEAFNFSFKKVSLDPIRRNDSINIDDRAIYAQKYLNLLGIVDKNNIVFINKINLMSQWEHYIVSLWLESGQLIRFNIWDQEIF